MPDNATASPHFTFDFDQISKAEADYISRRRKDIKLKKTDFDKFAKRVADMTQSDAAQGWKLTDGKVGLALSGGGIRSATFNLGLLQALAREHVLKFCDYLSTVSGGGYIGSCLSSLLDNPEASVEAEKFPFRFVRQKKADERKEVKWLRQHSNYLVQKGGLFSLDLWRFIGLFLSGLVLTNITTVWLTIFATYGVYLTVSTVPDPEAFAILTFGLSIVSFVIMVVARWGAALRNLGYKGRLWRGYIQGFLARTSAMLLALGGFVLLAIHLPRLEHETVGLVSSMLHGGSAGVGGGLLAGLFKSKNAKIEMLRKGLQRLALLALFPIAIAQLVRLLWSADHFGPTLFGVPLVLPFGVLLFLISLFTNTNRISMHHFYRDRLSEAYIIKREASDTIGLNEPCCLHKMHDHANGAPYHLINTTLNIPSSNNRWIRGRGADNFVFSKYYCGAQCTGYCPTTEYDNGDTRLATAMAISGAAVSPQSGEKSSSVMTFIFSLLNARLNRWMPNPDPARHAWIKFWPLYFLFELLDKGKEKDRLLNLSDGGHYENLAMVELIRRRCRLIIASDAGADPDFNFGDLANLMRKVRIDQGVEIKIDLSDLRQDRDSKTTTRHFAVGTIEYPDAPAGLLIYIKSSLTGDETEDLLAYQRANPTFPDQSTTDQFFDEAQFESYRELGYLVGREVLGGVAVGAPQAEPVKVTELLKEQARQVAEQRLTHLTDLVQQLSKAKV